MSSSTKYKVVKGHFYRLAVNLEQDLSKVAAKLFEIELIGSTSMSEARNANQVAFDRSSNLLDKVLKMIELDHSNYDRFLSVLSGFGHLAETAKELEVSLKLEQSRGYVPQSSSSSSVASSSSSSSSRLPKNWLVRHNSPAGGRRHSDGDIIRSRCKESTSRSSTDSGIPADLQGSTWFAGDQLSEEDDDGDDDGATISENSVPSKASDPLPAMTVATSMQSESNLQVLQSSKASPSALVFSSSGASAAGSKPLSCGSELSNSGSLTPGGGEHASATDDGDGESECVPPPKLVLFANSDAWNHQAENKYLKSENTEQASELSDLRQTIRILKEERASSAEKMEQQDRLVQQKDGEIADLQQRCEEKDRRVEDLLKDKAEMEKKVREFRERCLEAERKQAENQEEIELLHESYEARIGELQEKLEEVESREKVAKEELANARALLSEVKLQKEREIWKLQKEFYASENAKLRLEHSVQILEGEKKLEGMKLALELSEEKKKRAEEFAFKEKELALKEKEVALKEKELAEEKKRRADELAMKEKEMALKDKEILLKDKELAEKQAKEELKRFQEEAKEQLEKKEEERRKSVQELELEMNKLRLKHSTCCTLNEWDT